MRYPIYVAVLILSETLRAAGSTPTGIKLEASASPVLIGQRFTLTATVAPTTATGKVTFYEDGGTLFPRRVIGAATLVNGVATFVTSSLQATLDFFGARYTGDAQYAGSNASPVIVKVHALNEKGFLAPFQTTGALSFPRSIVVADFNEDGKLDLAAPSYDANLLNIMIGNGDGSFQPVVSYPTLLAPYDVVASDFNGDGHIDLAVANQATGSSSVSIFLGNGDGTMTVARAVAVGLNPAHLAASDVNGDGNADLVVTNFTDATITVLLGNGDGTFKALPAVAVPTGPGYIRVCDMSGDGIQDLVFLADGMVRIMTGKGDGTFLAPIAIQAGPSPSYLLVPDIDNDGRPDLVVANAGDDTITVLLHATGSLTFAAPITLQGPKGIQVVATGDFNGDNIVDLIAAGSTSNTFSVFFQNAGNTFKTPVSYAGGTAPIFLAVGDFNGDFRDDIAEADFKARTLNINLGDPVAQPYVAAIVNGASFTTAGLAPGLIFTIAGRELGPADGVTTQLDSQGRIASTLAGVSVTVNGLKAPLLFVRQDQINAIAPYSIAAQAGKTVALNVSYVNSGSSSSVSVNGVAPAIFSLGNGQGAIRNQDQSVNGPANPAAKGSYISIYATGEGQLIPGGVDGQLVSDANTHPVENITATIAGAPATVQFQGSTLFDGFLQINLLVPDNVPSGVSPVVFKIAGVPSQAGINVAIK